MKYLKNIKDWKELKNEVVCGDCLEGMKLIPDKSIDLVLTSPPYNLGNSHHTGNKRIKAYDDNLPEEDYQNWQIAILAELYRILTPQGSILYNHKNRIRDGVQISPYEWLFKTPFSIKQEVVWFNGSQNFDKCRFYPMTERIFWLSKSKDVLFKNITNRHDLFNYQAEGTGKDHARSFPLDMARELLANFQSNVVLDPFMGSWTTARACKDLGRDFIGFELDEKYCEIGEKRLRQEVMF